MLLLADIINIDNLDFGNIVLDENSNKDIFLSYFKHKISHSLCVLSFIKQMEIFRNMKELNI